MQVKTIIVAKNDVTPIQQICLNVTSADGTPSIDEFSEIDYNDLSAVEQAKFDDLMTILEAKAV